MSKVVKVEQGNYSIKVEAGENIILDTARGTTTPSGYPAGTTIIRGSLEVEGVTTTVESQDTLINDNILTINNGQTGAGISASKGSKAGIEIDRGSEPTASLLFDETINWDMGPTSGTGTFVFKDNTNLVLPLHIKGIDSQGSTFYIDTGNNVISVTNTSDYEEGIFTYSSGNIVDSGGGVIIDDDNIPNAKAVVDYINYSLTGVFQARIEEGTTSKTFVEASDFEVSGSPSVIEAGVDGTVKLAVYADRTETQDIRITGTKIETLASNSNMILESQGTGQIQINDVLNLTVQTDPSSPTNSVSIYNKTESHGGTGIFFKNKDSTSDELISNNRALLYGMLF